MFGTVRRLGADGHAQFTDKRDAEKVASSLLASAEFGEGFELEPCDGRWRIAKICHGKRAGFY